MIVDVGAGSGDWCIRVANQYPSATVHGLDLSPVLAEHFPDNCDFVVGDLANGLNYDDETIDLVHSR
jgi:ubiquinone/menaquinone biosynthesis C-methylase UbiE